MRQKTVKLSEAVEFAGQTYTALTLKKLKVKHMLEVNWDESKSMLDQYANLAAASAGVDVGVIHEMDMEDFAKVQEVLDGFFKQAAQASDPSTSGS